MGTPQPTTRREGDDPLPDMRLLHMPWCERLKRGPQACPCGAVQDVIAFSKTEERTRELAEYRPIYIPKLHRPEQPR